MDITKMTMTELKALAFDEQQKVSIAQNNLNLIAQQMQKLEAIQVQEANQKKKYMPKKKK